MSDFDYSDTEDCSYSNDGTSDPKRHARTQHNELERKRRNNIKDMYKALKDSIPGMQNERASRAVVLKKAVELISNKATNLEVGYNEIKELENEFLELQKEWSAIGNGNACSYSSNPVTESLSTVNTNEPKAVSPVVSEKLFLNRERPSAFDEFVPPSAARRGSGSDYIDITDLS